jgi:arginine utilization regulatory protein
MVDKNEIIFKAESKYAVGKNILDIFDDVTMEDSSIYKVINTGKPIMNRIRTFSTMKGSRNVAVTSILPIFKDNEMIGAIEIFEDINNSKKLSDMITEDTSGNLEYMPNGTKFTLNDIIGNCEGIQELKKKIFQIADSRSSVLIYGETGTGKELVAQSIHNSSFKRRRKSFVAQNCAAIPGNLLESILFGTTEGSFTGAKEKPGLFELADGGTLFLDEINSMDMDLQSKLLRVLQEGVIRRVGGKKTTSVDVRIIASTNTPPHEAVEQGKIREDLYYRLNVIPIKVLPLRERKTDLKILTEYFIDYYNKVLMKDVKNISQECIVKFMEYDWPGNVREFKFTIENAMNFVDGNKIHLCNIPERIKNMKTIPDQDLYEDKTLVSGSLKDAISQIETRMIVSALNKLNGNKTKAASLLDIPRQSLNNKIKKYNIVGDFKTKNR